MTETPKPAPPEGQALLREVLRIAQAASAARSKRYGPYSVARNMVLR